MPIKTVVEVPKRKKEANDSANKSSAATTAAPAVEAKEVDPDFVEPSTLSQEDRVKKSDAYKAKANKSFGEQKYENALEDYSKAIQYHPTAILHSNRSFCYFKKEFFVAALQDAIKATEMDPMYVKGYYRLGQANMALGNYEEAKNNFQNVVKQFPNDAEGRQKLKTVLTLIKKKAFEDAIQFTNESHFKDIDFDSMIVEESYKGPRFEGEEITLEFVNEMIEWMKSQKFLHRKYITKILKQSFDLFSKMPSLVDIDHETTQKITICGDTHGQYYDLLHIFEINGLPSKDKPYLFNGDFVDRGSFSLEVIITLLAYKLLYPDHMHLTRGNHETVDMNRYYGFHGEVMAKYSETIYDMFAELFSWFPLAFVLDESYLVVHGGLFGRDGVTLDDIRKINRNSPDTKDNELVQCLLWSDPQANPGIAPSSRGVGVYFGPDVTRKFLKENNLCGVIRSHEVKQDGYQIDDEGAVITIFSAPNYCDQSGNLGAYINFGQDTLKFTTFSEVPHPPRLLSTQVLSLIKEHGYSKQLYQVTGELWHAFLLSLKQGEHDDFDNDSDESEDDIERSDDETYYQVRRIRRMPSPLTTLSICFLGLVWLKEPVILSDLVHMIHNGSLPHNFLIDNSPAIKWVKREQTLYSYDSVKDEENEDDKEEEESGEEEQDKEDEEMDIDEEFKKATKDFLLPNKEEYFNKETIEESNAESDFSFEKWLYQRVDTILSSDYLPKSTKWDISSQEVAKTPKLLKLRLEQREKDRIIAKAAAKAAAKAKAAEEAAESGEPVESVESPTKQQPETTTTTTTTTAKEPFDLESFFSQPVGDPSRNPGLKESAALGVRGLMTSSSFRTEERYVKELMAAAKNPNSPELSDIVCVFDKLMELAQVDTATLKKMNFDYFHMFVNILLEVPALTLQENRMLHMMLLKKLNGIIFSNILIQTYCCNDRWIIKLLNFLIGCSRDSDVIGEISITLQILCFFSITPKELKYLLRLLESVNDERPFYWSVLVEVLVYIFRQKEGPDTYFNFSNSSAGLMIPEKEPFDGGYTFGFWISADDFSKVRFQPVLYSFFTDDECGLECYFSGQSLVYSIKTKNKVAIQKSQFVFQPKRCQLSFYVNGKLEEKIPLLYPKTDKPYTRCHIGNSSSLSNGFIGRMGSILMVNEALTMSEIQSIYQLGKDYTLLHEKMPREGAIGIYNGELFLENRKNIKVLFIYYPKATDKALCFEVSSGELPNAATIMEGVNIIKTTPPIEQLIYVGGLCMLYPLFYQLGHSVNGMETRAADINDDTSISSGYTDFISMPASTHAPPPIFPRPIHIGHPGVLLRLLLTVLENQMVFREQIIDTQGFQTISFLLMSHTTSAPFWTPDDIEELGRLLSFCSSNQQLWALSVQFMLVNNFQLWSQTHSLTQMALFESIRQRVQTNTHFWRNNVKVEQWLSILRRYYPLRGGAIDLASSGGGMKKNDIPLLERTKRARSQIFVILRESANPMFTLAETRWITLYLKESTIENQEDITKMLEDMIPPIHLTSVKMDPFGEILEEAPTLPRSIVRTSLPVSHVPLPKHISYLWEIDCADEIMRRREELVNDEKMRYLLNRHWIKLRRRRAGNLAGAKVKRTLEQAGMPIIFKLKELGIQHSTLLNSVASTSTPMSPTIQSPATSPPMSPSGSPPRASLLTSPSGSTGITNPTLLPELEPEDSTVVHWKLDRTEGPCRMRRKLKRNYLGSDYKGVSKQNKFSRNRRAIIDIYPTERETFYIDQDCGDGLGHIILALRNDPPLDPSCAMFKEREFAGATSTSLSSNSVMSPMKSELHRTPSKAVLQATHQTQSPTFSPANSTVTSPARETTTERFIGAYTCQLVMPIGVVPGKLTITTHTISFDKDVRFDANGRVMIDADHGCVRVKKHYILRVRDLVEIHRKRYLLRWNSIEIFLNNKSYMFTFSSESESISVFNKIVNLHPPQLKVKWADHPAKILKRAKITQRWKNREISNFEYLMLLNTIAGRTYNDISQYPIFPHILANYTSEVLDLSDPSVYRDLSKPIGALNAQRLDTLVQRYQSFKDPLIPPFLYGSHYSNFGIVAYYHVRLEPFTSYHLSLQGGVWDHPQRMFESVERMWEGVTSANLADVKELTPEFFYMPEFVSNFEQFNFGFTKSTNGDLALPKWAHQSPEIFIAKNREALESEYVSMHLHLWIDLIFGHKQTGQAAIDANNVFFHLTYEGNEALERDDPDERGSIESQIKEFGQTPPQLFVKPHPKRKTLQELNRPQRDILTKFANLFPSSLLSPTAGTVTDDSAMYPFRILKTNSCLPLVHIGACSESDTIVLVYRDGVLAVNQFVPTPSGNLPFTFDIDRTLSTYREKQIDTLFMSDSVTCISNCFAMTPDGKMLFSCANWDSIFKCCNIQNGKVHRLYRDFHRGMVTCMAMGASGRTLATASTDTSILVWDDVAALIKETRARPAHRLCSHDDAVHCIDVNEEWDIIASGSQDRKCIIHNLRTGAYVRTMLHRGAVEIVKISTLLKMEACDEKLYDIKLTGESTKKGGVLGVGDSGQFLVTGGTRGVKVRSLPDLSIVNAFDSPTTIRTIALVAHENL
eukprot:gene14506-17121_t